MATNIIQRHYFSYYCVAVNASFCNNSSAWVSVRPGPALGVSVSTLFIPCSSSIFENRELMVKALMIHANTPMQMLAKKLYGDAIDIRK